MARRCSTVVARARGAGVVYTTLAAGSNFEILFTERQPGAFSQVITPATASGAPQAIAKKSRQPPNSASDRLVPI